MTADDGCRRTFLIVAFLPRLSWLTLVPRYLTSKESLERRQR